MEQATDQNRQLGKWLAGAAAGALFMYMLDPERGAPRRARSREKLRELGHQTGSMVDKLVQGVGSRVSEASSAVRSAASDAGSAIQDLGSRASQAAQRTVEQVAPALTQHNDSEGRSPMPDGHADGAASAPMQSLHNLAHQAGGAVEKFAASPGSGMRSLGLAGAALGLYGLFARRSPLALAAGLAGMALLARGTGDHSGPATAGAGKRARSAGRSLRSMLSAATPARPVVVEKTIRIDASPEQVYDMFANYENFPRYMSNVVEVRDLGQRRSHWVVRGPAGTHFQWDALLTESTRPRRLAWESEPGAEVEQTGSILFEPFRNGTRVTVHMSYKPPAGAVGHALASLLGSDPKRQMDEDLSRMKSLVERGGGARQSSLSGGAENTFLH